MGTNAGIFAAQTVHLQSLLPADYEWVFIDGPTECDAAPGVAAFFSPPYLCWYTTPTTAKMDFAHHLISSVIERNGPFDAVMGFSQSLDFGIDARKYFGLRGIQRPSKPGCPTTVPAYLVTDPAYLEADNEQDESSSSSSSDDDSQPFRKRAHPTFYQMYHFSVDTVRIQIPTVHIYGRQDKWRLHSKDLVSLCPKNLATVFEHDGGHEIPKSASEDICDAIETPVAGIHF
ncbi:MAG: hypothetical protein Q9226_006865 [Calogaya cf. arnoldii]